MSTLKKHWQFTLLWLIGLSPLVLAWTMAATGWGVPDQTKNNGDLMTVNDPVPEELQRLYERKWGLLLLTSSCAKVCQHQEERMNKLHIGLGKEFHRLRTISLNADYLQISSGVSARQAEDNPFISIARWFSSQHLPIGDENLWLIDPNGNLVLRFPSELKGKEILTDIRWLLRVSRVG